MKVENVLKEIQEIKKYKVNLKKQEVILKADQSLDITSLKRNLEELDYKVLSIEEL